MTNYQSPNFIKAALFRTVLLTIVWWSLTDGASASWFIGVPVIMVIVYMSLKTLAPVNINLFRLILFMPFFVRHSVIGGSDVAKRAISAKVQLHPGLVEFRPHIDQGLPMFTLLSIVNLLPGTLCTDLQDGTLQIHVLDENLDYLKELQAIETRVAQLFY